MRTHLIHRPARDISPPHWWSSSFLLSHLILSGRYAAVAPLVHLNSVPSIQMRCIITANRRASATIAFFIPRCLATFIAQALSHDHFAERSSIPGQLHRALSETLADDENGVTHVNGK